MIGDGSLMYAAMRAVAAWVNVHAMGVALTIIIGGYAIFAIAEVLTR